MLHGIVNGTSGVFLLSSGIQGIASFLNSDICALSSDGYHYADSFFDDHIGEGKDGAKYAEAICKFCGERFLCYASDLSAAYDDYVKELPASGYNSNGGLIWDTFSSFIGSGSYRTGTYASSLSEFWMDSDVLPCIATRGGSDYSSPLKYWLDSTNSAIAVSTLNDNSYFLSGIKVVLAAPISGSYRRISSPHFSIRGLRSDGTVLEETGNFSQGSFSHFSSGDSVSVSSQASFSNKKVSFASGLLMLPIYEIIPDTVVSGDVYNINTRPASITGGNYGIVGDNGQITRVEGNTIVNETNNTYYNPSTGTTVPIVNWSYDYSDRSYKVTLESGDTATITYGDEHITIHEGDTVYNVYYLVDGSGTEQPPEVCIHEWSETSRTDPTCTVAGQAVSTCSKCQEVKTEPVPALGHDWQVKQTVTTQYDDTGQLIQQGYTLFECSRCQEQYKSDDGTAPPGGGSGTDPGGEDGEGFLSWLLGKIGELLGTIGNGILNLLQTALEKIFGGLIDMVNSLFENLSKLVDLFGSVGEAFQVLWTWLPPEIMAILVAGVSIFVFVALIKFFMK